MDRRELLTFPNSICLLRFVLAPVLLVLAWYGRHDVFIPVLVSAFLLDALDGPLARYLHQESELGPRLDTTADVAIYLVLPVCIWWLWPDLIRSEWVYVLLIIASILAPMITGFIKFRRPTSYHTWLVKAAATITAISIFVLLLGGPELPFRIASFVCLAAGLEEILITLALDNPKSNVRGLVHVLKSRN